MRLFAMAALVAGLTVSGAASAGTVFYEGFDGYDLSALARGATGASVATSSLVDPYTGTPNSFSTDYGYRTGTSGAGHGDLASMYDEGTWTIGTNPHTSHDLWKTVGGTNNMLIINGKVSVSEANPAMVWSSNAFNVAAGSYTLSFDLMNVCCEAPSNGYSTSTLWIEYKGAGDADFVRIVAPLETLNGAGIFYQQAQTFTVGAGSLRVGLFDSDGDPSGNDFAIDNIMVAAVPEPITWSLMLIGFGGIGAALRSQRRRRYAAA